MSNPGTGGMSMTDNSPLVKLRSLTREYSSQASLFGKRRVMRAVNEVTLDVPRGRVTGVVGESGCGKSTLARLVLRLIEASSGSVHFDGVNLAEVSRPALRQLRQRLQMVFQDPYSAIDPRFTVRRAILEPFKVQSTQLESREATARVNDLLDQVGLSRSMATSYPHQLSGGQKQRVGIARALALKPSFLVLDEPTAALDVSIQAQIIELLADLQTELELTYLFISHDLGLVRYFCDQVVVMYLGRVVEILDSDDAEPRHHYTHALMDSNFEPDPKQRKLVTLLKGEIPSPFAPLPGCAFAARCPAAAELCHTSRPALQSLGPIQAVACHFPRH